MMKELNASGFVYNNTFYNSEFEQILSKIIICYQLMIEEGVIVCNDENKIRDALYLNYLNDNVVRGEIGLKDYYFDRETREDNTKGRTDIRVLTTYSFEDTSAYYIIECKRLNSTNVTGRTGLNAEYVNSGIVRFTSASYSSYYKTNGMIGFIIEPIKIDQNVIYIKQLIEGNTEIITLQNISHKRIVENFDYSYISIHTIKSDKVVLYHLMLDFSNNIQ